MWNLRGSLLLAVFGLAAILHAQSKDTILLRGHQQQLRIYGTRGIGDPVIVSSGDGGWIHQAPHVAQALASKGFFVIGFDAKAYLESFTSATSTLRPEDEPGDFRTLVAYAQRVVRCGSRFLSCFRRGRIVGIGGDAA
jgi:hypothetical protein